MEGTKKMKALNDRIRMLLIILVAQYKMAFRKMEKWKEKSNIVAMARTTLFSPK